MPQSRILPCLALALMTLDAQALGIGEIISQPRLGERLRIEVRLHADDGPVDPACIRLSPGDSSDDLPWVRGARLRIQGGARPVLVIESNEPINHPIYLLGLRIGCGAEVRREFTLMPQAPNELPVTSPVIPSAPGLPATNEAQPAAAGGWQTVEGETLAGIASGLFPNDAASQKSFVREAVKANPRLFRDVADPGNHPLPGGENLALPGTGTHPVPSPKATKPRPPRESRKPREARIDESPPAPQLPKSAQPVRQSEDRLSVASGVDGEPGLKFTTLLNDARSRGLTEEQRERLRQEQRLIAELDEKIIASLALAEKIRNIEGYLDKLQGDMAQLDQKIQTARDTAATPTPSAPASVAPVAPKIAAKPPAPRPAETDDSDWWLYGLIAAGIALLGLLWMRRKRGETVEIAEYAEQSAETEIPKPAVAAAEPTLAQQVPMQRVDLAPPLELELEAPVEHDAKIGVAEHDSALELAEIMLSFGRVQGAAQTLTDYIHTNPRQAVRPWLKLLEIYHGAGMRNEFEALMGQFHQNFNVQKVNWTDYAQDLSRNSLEEMPHLMQEVIASWPSRACLELLQGHLRDNREGTRNGFPLSIADDMAMLIGLLESRHSTAPQPA